MQVKKSVAVLVTSAGLVLSMLGAASAEESSGPQDEPSVPTESAPAPDEGQPEEPDVEVEPDGEDAPEGEEAEVPPSASPRSAAAALPTKTSLTPTSWTSVVQDRARGSVTVTANGKAAPGARVSVKFAGPSPRTLTVTTNSSGKASYSTPLGKGQYRLTASVIASDKYQASTSKAVRQFRQAGRRVSVMVNRGDGTIVRKGENFWIRGKVLRADGTPHKGVRVTIYRYAGSKRHTSARVRTNAQGVYTWTPPKRSKGQYRAKASNSQVSVALKVIPSSGRRTLESRRDSMSFLLGSAQGGVKTAKGHRYQSFYGGLIIETPSNTRLVRGKRTRAELHKRGGVGGSLGLPLADARCGLPEGGCLQTYQKGSTYSNPKAKQPITSAVASRRYAGDLVAVALSQVSYREPARRKSKYNRWMGDTSAGAAWCGYFTAWTAYAAGKPNSVIKRNRFAKLAAAERKRGRTSKTPAVGRLAYFGSSSKKVHHTGIVTKVTKTHIRVVEGNVTGGKGSASNRGVYHQTWPRSRVAFYADPLY